MCGRVRYLGAVVVAVAMLAGGVQTTLATAARAAGSSEHNGDNDGDSRQGGTSASGDAVAGQVVGSQSSGDTSIDATNSSDDVDVESGDADAGNSATVFAGENVSADVNAVQTGCSICIAVGAATVSSVQDGDNHVANDQAADASSGDGIGGQVIASTDGGGNTAIVATNRSEDVDIHTGDSEAINDATVFAGENVSADVNAVQTGCFICIAVGAATVSSAQDGSNLASNDQAADASSGDGIGGQTIASTNGGGTTAIDGTNRSEDVDIHTGDSEAINDATVFAGENVSADVNAVQTGCFICVAVGAASVSSAQDGSNHASNDQAANASSGDGIGGQTIASTNGRGTTSIVATNASEDVDIDTGDTEALNFGVVATGANVSSDLSAVQTGCFICVASDSAEVSNVQDDNNHADDDQAADASSGDGIGGQVIASTNTGGRTSIDATNDSVGVDLDTGDATAEDDSDASSGDGIGGQLIGSTNGDGSTLIAARNGSHDVDIDTGDAAADNSGDASSGDGVGGQVIASANTGEAISIDATNLSQNVDIDTGDAVASDTDASSGDGVAGQVIGAVNSGDTLSIVEGNTSTDVNLDTGDAQSANHENEFVGENVVTDLSILL